MEEEIEKLGQVIDILRAKASDPKYRDYLLAWLDDPMICSHDVGKLLTLRDVIYHLNDQRAILIDIHETQKLHDEDGHCGTEEDEVDA